MGHSDRGLNLNFTSNFGATAMKMKTPKSFADVELGDINPDEAGFIFPLKSSEYGAVKFIGKNTDEFLSVSKTVKIY